MTENTTPNTQDARKSVTQTNRAVFPPISRVSQLNKTEKKAIIFKALTEQGFSQYAIAQLIECDKSHINRIAQKEYTGILAPLATVARRRIKDVLSGKAIENTDKAKTSDVLNAATMVLDRVEPKVSKTENKSMSMHVEMSADEYSRIGSALEAYTQRHTPQHIVIEQERSQEDNTELQSNQSLKD